MITFSHLKRGVAAFGFALLGSAFAAGPAHATTLIPLDTDDLSHLADVIVVAEIQDVRFEVTSHATGKSVRTFNEAKVLEVWKGDVEVGSTLDVVELGGRAGNDWAHVEGTAGYLKKERVLLFLEPRLKGKPGYLTIGMFQGKFTLLPNGRGGYGLTRKTVPLTKRGLPFDASLFRGEIKAEGSDFVSFGAKVKAVVDADRKAGIRGKDLPQYKGMGR